MNPDSFGNQNYMYFDDVSQYNEVYFPVQQNVTGPFINPQFRQDLTNRNTEFTDFFPQTSENQTSEKVANICSTTL